jgi:hypothetical protein
MLSLRWISKKKIIIYKRLKISSKSKIKQKTNDMFFYKDYGVNSIFFSDWFFFNLSFLWCVFLGIKVYSVFLFIFFYGYIDH